MPQVGVQVDGVPEGLKRHWLLQPLACFIVHGEFAIHSFIHPPLHSFIHPFIHPSLHLFKPLHRIRPCAEPHTGADRPDLHSYSSLREQGSGEGRGEILLCAQIISNEA